MIRIIINVACLIFPALTYKPTEYRVHSTLLALQLNIRKHKHFFNLICAVIGSQISWRNFIPFTVSLVQFDV